MVERSKRSYSPPAIKDCGRITEQALQSTHRSPDGSPEPTDPVQPRRDAAGVEEFRRSASPTRERSQPRARHSVLLEQIEPPPLP